MNSISLKNNDEGSAKIYLLGFMGSGKSTIGKQLAELLNYSFIDTDMLIEEQNMLTVDEIFSVKGEDYFRQQETVNLESSANWESCLVSTGGGAPCFNNNIDLINSNGLSIYLKLSVDELFKRLTEDRGSRPLLKNKTDEELFNYIKITLSQREKYYKKAKVIADAQYWRLSDYMYAIQTQI